MVKRGFMMVPMVMLLLTVAACTGLHTTEGRSPEAMKQSELSKNDLWNHTKTLESEKTACQKQLVDQEGAIAELNRRLSDQQNAVTRANRQIAELTHTIDDLSTKLKEAREVGKKGTPASPIDAAPAMWGAIMQVHNKTHIRAKRSLQSKIKGYLVPGQPVKTDFLKDDWYAVFKATETVRSEKNALGYVYAPRLFKTPPESEAEAREKGSRSAADQSVPERFTVAVRSIRHQVLPEGKEVLLVEFDRFYVPAVYNIEGEAPRIIMDITRTASMKKEWSEMRASGKLIRKIHVNLDRASQILRIVMDMTPEKDYDIKPTYYAGKESQVYALEVTGVSAGP